MSKIKVTNEELSSFLIVFLLLEKALQHMDDYPASDLYSNELYWFRCAQRELGWLISHVENYSPALLDAARKNGLQLRFDEGKAVPEYGAH